MDARTIKEEHGEDEPIAERRPAREDRGLPHGGPPPGPRVEDPSDQYQGRRPGDLAHAVPGPPSRAAAGGDRDPMSHELARRSTTGPLVPALIAAEGDQAARRFFEFFTANIE